MGRVRVFYGHEGVVPPTGSWPRSAAPAAPVEDAEPVEVVGELVEGGDVVEPGHVERLDGSEVPVGDDGVPVLDGADLVDADAEIDDGDAEIDDAEVEAEEHVEGEASGLPDEEWTGPELDAFAEENGIDLTGAKKTKGDKLARILESLKEQ